MARGIIEQDLDFAGRRVFGPRAPVTADDIVRYGDLSLGIASSSALAALTITSGMDTGLPKWVATRRRLFMLDKTAAGSTLPGEPGNVIVAADGTSRWVAMPTPDAYWNSRTAWGVHPVSGSDEAATADVQTLRELNRRLWGSVYDFQTVISADDDVPLSDATVLHNVRSINGLGFPTMIGKKTQIGGDYAVTSFVAADPDAVGGGTGYLVNATGIGDSANLGKLIETTDGTICAWIQDNPSANQVRVLTPSTADPMTGDGGSLASFSGHTVRVYDLTRLPVYPFGPLAAFSAVGWMRFGFGYASPNFHAGKLGSSSPFIARCMTEGAHIDGGTSAAWSACMFTDNGGDPTIFSGHNAFLNWCGVRGASPGLSIESGSSCIPQSSGGADAALDVHASKVHVELSGLRGGMWSFSSFGCADAIRIVIGGDVNILGRSYGRNNTGHLLVMPSGCNDSVINSSGINWGTTSAHIAQAAGVEQDLPFVDLLTDSAVVNP